jgi:hypothetical protein
MVNYWLFTGNIFLRTIAFPNKANLDVVEFGLNYFDWKDTLTIPNNALIAHETFPYLIVINLHYPIPLDPEVMNEFVFLVDG